MARAPVFEQFVAEVEPRLRRALVAGYGPHVGREATVDALSWAWEHWDRVQAMDNPTGYLYRVGQSRARAASARRRIVGFDVAEIVDDVDVEPQLLEALGRLSPQQRSSVLLVHGYGMSQREAAEVLGVAVSTLRAHVDRAMARLRSDIGEVV